MLRKVASITIVFFAATLSYAEPTAITVRVRSHDAKFIGSAAGGVGVVITDADSGRVLAQGLIRGGTGDTKAIMKTAHARRQEIAGPKAASYVAHLNIRRPTKVRIEVRGPLAGGRNAHLASRTLVVLPGHDIAGDGVVFELYGCIVDIVSPTPHEFFKPGQTVTIDADVVMLCGCPVMPGGLWDAGEFDVRATISDTAGKKIAEIPLQYAGTTSHFRADFKPAATGGYRVVVTAALDASANYGYAIGGFVVKAPPAAKTPPAGAPGTN